MENLTPPKYVKQVMDTLLANGHRCYLVGGCVRDLLLSRRPNDWDVCTSALPDDILAAFPRAYPTGLKHGTVTVAVGKHRVEVTTFRADGDYLDHRRPESVRFVSRIEEDLARRDFTVNAMAVGADGVLLDPYGGQDDLQRQCIRCVGEAETRFEEDALRMLRAVRFSAKLGFDIEAKTSNAIYRKAALAAGLSPERVCDEIRKILLSPQPGIFSRLMSYGLIDRYLLRPKAAVSLRRLARLPNIEELRWAGLCAMLIAHRLIASPESFLRELRLDNATIRSVSAGLAAIEAGVPADAVAWKRILANEGAAAAQCAAAAADMLHPTGCLHELAAVRDSGECWSMDTLCVNGNDLLMLGMRGIELGHTLRALLDHVLEHPEDNTREKLLALCRSLGGN